jgi:hypothetical protein
MWNLLKQDKGLKLKGEYRERRRGCQIKTAVWGNDRFKKKRRFKDS